MASFVEVAVLLTGVAVKIRVHVCKFILPHVLLPGPKHFACSAGSSRCGRSPRVANEAEKSLATTHRVGYVVADERELKNLIMSENVL